MSGQLVSTRDKAVTLRGVIKKMGSEFKAALPPQIDVDRFTRTVFTCVQVNPKLLECTQESVLASIMKYMPL